MGSLIYLLSVPACLLAGLAFFIYGLYGLVKSPEAVDPADIMYNVVILMGVFFVSVIPLLNTLAAAGLLSVVVYKAVGIFGEKEINLAKIFKGEE